MQELSKLIEDMAGGFDGAFHRQRNTWVLEGPEFTWGTATVALPAVQASSAGLLLGDQLVCMGGWEDEVGWCVELVVQGWSVPQGLSLWIGGCCCCTCGCE